MSFLPASWSAPDAWPAQARGGLLLLIAVLAALLLGQLSLRSDMRLLDQLQAQARQGREDYRSRLAQSQAMVALRQQRVALHDALWSHPPGETPPVAAQAWTEALLRDIHRAGRGRLRFELFRPGQPVTRPHHEELPFTLRALGTYPDITAFVTDLATLTPGVVLDRLMLLPRASKGEAGDTGAEPGGLLALDLVARASRPLAAPRQTAAAPAPTSPGKP
ncbi:pilus assembly protein PilO [Hylemonella gracilis str. Niagara R]|uniref:Pilus assembly protein PilO n=1 Tax=Hylemonella gracilis str. Niagara R TaxID=1458275 RepID=A0A016XKB1_9BURK|nr:type 4a pilus biogenesis protein PilO [Hylemonella gracilis]EYC52291.1 pilus assembly protein PilO [Hylemonella gracilis str. Niagara R]